jgi:hypothetical protein
LGQKQTSALQKAMSALPPKADMCGALAHVCFGPIADSCGAAKSQCFATQDRVRSALKGKGVPNDFLKYVTLADEEIGVARRLEQ